MRKHTQIAISTVFLFLYFIPLVAQSTDSLRQVNLEELVVSVSRQPSANRKLTQQVISIPLQDIEESNSPTTAELLTENGGITVQKSQQGGGSPAIRGFEASRILLFVDNIPMNNLIYRSGHLQNVITIDPSILQNIDVLFGPSSVAYGSDALGGVIHFFTKNPKLNQNLKSNLMTRFATVNNEKSTHVNFSYGRKKWAFLTSFSYSDFGDLKSGKNKNPFLPDGDNYIDRIFIVERKEKSDLVKVNDKNLLQTGSAYKQWDAMQKILFVPNRYSKHILNLQYSSSSNIPRYDRLTETVANKTSNTPEPKFAEWFYGPQDRLLAAYHFETRKISFADKSGITLAYQHVKESRHNRRLNNPELENRTENVSVLTLSAFLSKKTEKGNFNLGMDGALNFLKSTAYGLNLQNNEKSPLDTRYPGGKNNMRHLDFYSSYSHEISGQLELSAGIRAGYSTLFSEFTDNTFFPFIFDTIEQNNFTYSFSLGGNYATESGWRLASHVSSGFRVPNVDDLAKVFDSKPGIVIIPNPELKPEKTVGIDISVEKTIEETLRWENHIFVTYLFDAIGLTKTRSNGLDSIIYSGIRSKVFSNTNYNRAILSGFSSQISYSFTRNVGSKASVNYVYGQVLSQNSMPLDHISPLNGKVSVDFISDSKKWNAEIFSLFNGAKTKKRYNLNGEDNINYATVLGEKGNGTPAWFTINLRVGYSPLSILTIQTGINNMLDTKYRPFASGINAPGRNIYVSLRLSI